MQQRIEHRVRHFSVLGLFRRETIGKTGDEAESISFQGGEGKYILLYHMTTSNMAVERERKVPPFNPQDHGLSEDFRLINFTKLKG